MLLLFGFVDRAIKKVLKRDVIISIYFHNPNAKLFESCIRWLQKKGFHFISLDELAEIVKGKKPFPRGAAIITVDDGWENNKNNIVKTANKLEVPVTIFISTEPVEEGTYWWPYIQKAYNKGICKYSVQALKKVSNEQRLQIVNEVKHKISLNRQALTVGEVQEIARSKYISIGSHTVTHPILPNCSYDGAIFEIMMSKITLEHWIHKDVENVAFPNGNFTNREINILKATGYQMAFTTDTKFITKEEIATPYTLPRIGIDEYASFTEVICRMAGVWFNKTGFHSNI
jgi:peptidoglycan/xylan/chitin deacetylase (PgdA/CDA1 family)